jgi:lipid A 3-O-deacylase
MPSSKPILFILFCLITNSTFAAEEHKEEDTKRIFGVIVENDLFGGTDKDYTNGVRLSVLSGEEQMPRWIKSLANVLPLAEGGNKRIGVSIGQSLFTPQGITLRNPPTDDHPYAGWLYGSVGMISDTGKTFDNVMLTLGIVGPSAFGEQTQSAVHHVIGSPHPEGWDHQLKDEPGAIFTYERKWRGIYEFSPLGIGIDFTPHAGLNLGNIYSDVTLGATFRLGYDLPVDYGPPRVRPSLPGSDFFVPTKNIGGYLFTTIGERVVGRNIFLEGNTFVSSPHVDKEIFVNSLQVGAAVTYKEARISYTQVFISKEYETQARDTKFGVITVSWRF